MHKRVIYCASIALICSKVVGAPNDNRPNVT